MTRAQAKQIAKKLSAEGMSRHVIGPELAKLGYKSTRTGEALTQGGVYALLRPAKRAPRAQQRNSPQRTAPHRTAFHRPSRNDALHPESSAAPEERITLALMILEQHA